MIIGHFLRSRYVLKPGVAMLAKTFGHVGPGVAMLTIFLVMLLPLSLRRDDSAFGRFPMWSVHAD